MTRFPVYASMPLEPRIFAACIHWVGTGPILLVESRSAQTYP